MKLNENLGLNNSLKLIAKSSLIVLFGILLSKILTYFYRIVIAREFGAEVYGTFMLAFMIVGWLTAISSLGFYHGLLRYVSQYRGKKEIEKIKYSFKIVLFTTTTLSIFLGLLLLLFSDFIAIEIFNTITLSKYLKYFSLAVPLTVILLTFFSILRAYELVGWNSFFENILSAGLKLFLLVFLVFLGFKTNAIIFSFILSLAFVTLISYLFIKKNLIRVLTSSNLPKSEKVILRRDLFSYSWPLLFAGILSTILYWIDSFFIGVFKSSTEVGFYNAAIPIAMLLLVSSDMFMQLFLPLINKSYAQKDLPLIKNLSKQVGKWILIINLPIFILLLFFPGTFINLFFGEEYLVASSSLRILSVGVLFSSVFSISAQAINMLGKSKLYLLNMVLAATLNTFLNYFLVPLEKIFWIDNSLGINGAAISTSISLLFLYSLFSFQSYYFLRMFPVKRKIINILGAVTISTYVLFFLRGLAEINLTTLLLLSSFFFLLYFFLLVALNGLDKNDFYVIKSIKKKLFG